MDAIFEAPDDLPQIVVFVNEVGSDEISINPNSQPHRGAYFLFIGDRKGAECSLTDWQEILLGTHSHENKEQLDSLANLAHDNTEEMLLSVDNDGNFKLVEPKIGEVLPPLPIEFQNKLKELEIYKSLHEPEESEWHHLDADLDLLRDTYDWLVPDENGNYKNIAAGNCRDLYHSLIKSEKKLYIDKDYKLTSEGGLSYFALEIYNVNLDDTKKFDNYENVITDTTDKRSILKITTPCFLEENDEFFLFINNDVLSNNEYTIISKDISYITIAFNKYKVEPIQQ